MWPLFVCAIVAVAVMIERQWVLAREQRISESVTQKVTGLLKTGDAARAQAIAEQSPGVVARVLAAGLQFRDRGPVAVEQAMVAAALRQLPLLNVRLGWLDTIITMAPLLGLLGTITGMIRAFQVVATVSGATAAPAITGGVAEALIATAAGLAVAVTTLPVFNSLSEKARDITSFVEASSTEVQSLLSAHPAAVVTASETRPVSDAALHEREVPHATAATAP
jgi:biopolymer transport protein ExbB